MKDTKENRMLYNLFQYLRYDKSVKLKFDLYRKIRSNEIDYLDDIMTKLLKIIDGKVVAKVGHGWNRINEITIGLIAQSCVDTFIEQRLFISASHPKTYLINDPVPSDDYVFIGYDTRKDSKKYATIMANVFHENGYKINMPDEPCLAPFVSYMANYSVFRCGVYITGYPYSEDYSGVRLYLEDGCIITNDFASCINKKIEQRKYVKCNNVFVNEDFDYDSYLLMFAKHFLFGTNNTLVNMFKNIQFRNQNRITVSCMYGPSLRVLDVAKEYYSLQGIFCIYKPHTVLHTDYDDKDKYKKLIDEKQNNEKLKDEKRKNEMRMDETFINTNLLDDNLIRFAEYYKSEYIFFLDDIGIKFKIAAKQYNNWRMYTVDDLVSYFCVNFNQNLKPLDTMIINDYNCTNLGAVMSMSYGFRYYRAGINNLTIQNAYCKYRHADKQINNYFVYNNNFEFICYYGKEASCIHMTLLATIFIHYNLPDVTIHCTKYLFGRFDTKLITFNDFNDTKFEEIKSKCTSYGYELVCDKNVMEFFADN
ncbi:Phosphoglucomutase-2 [Binucleata daphniae]